MRKPNGYGSIKKLSGNRRRPFVFVVTQEGRQRPVEYFETQIEAEIYQADYNKIHKNHVLPGHKITFAEVFYRWLPAHIADTEPAETTVANYHNAFRHCALLHEMPITDIKYADYQQVIDRMKKERLSYASCKKVRSLISLLLKFASEYEIVNKNYAPLLKIGRNKPIRPHKPFSRQQINRLWQCGTPGTDAVLILLYTGMRVGELLALEKRSVNMRQRFIRITKSKTVAGIRIIPIHSKVFPLFEARMDIPGPLFLTDPTGRPYNYSRFCSLWNHIMAAIHARHTTHDCRHTVTTLLDNADANENAKRRILGHAGGDVTDRVYTHKNLRQLRKAIQLLK
ncbi:MAG: tyrosine-type recombinase/integrase [Acidaminococcaceae bacterium]|nr:tyrosine-type recombinase/integrase [Acidaminococcaceae bacterium]MBQ9634697.1 tyrosine-type recombinase/integrase [Acidaminococcaceae bacterium]